MTVLSIKSVWKWEIDIIFQTLIGKSVTHFNEINKCSFDSWISSITSKISWIVSWPLTNHVCVCVCECASVSVCNWLYKLIHGAQKQILVFFCLKIWILAWRSLGKIMELFSEIFVETLSPCCWGLFSKFGLQRLRSSIHCQKTGWNWSLLSVGLRWTCPWKPLKWKGGQGNGTWYLGPLLLTWFNFNPSMDK